MTNPNFSSLPSVNEVLARPEVRALIDRYGRPVALCAVRTAIDRARTEAGQTGRVADVGSIAASACARAGEICDPSPVRVINATGIVIHTNLGRAPLGAAALDRVADVAGGYSNLEFDLTAGNRGRRDGHVREILRFLTGAEDAVVVNNNAAGIVLTLHTLAAGREVLISRGELIEIGGSFRIPDIMAAGGARMVEVGTTNRTRLADYETAVTPQTAMIFKAHKSNYTIRGFTEEAGVRELADLARARGLAMVYDLGSGLLRRLEGTVLDGEPDVHSAIADGADLVAFSCDKLLGGPQAGIVAGRADLVARLAKAPLMRALRVGKMTLAALSAACRGYLTPAGIPSGNPALEMLALTREQLEARARTLAEGLAGKGVAARVAESTGHTGGGTAPDTALPSFAVEITGTRAHAERLYAALLHGDPPVVGILREGRLALDVLTLFARDLADLQRAVVRAAGEERPA